MVKSRSVNISYILKQLNKDFGTFIQRKIEEN